MRLSDCSEEEREALARLEARIGRTHLRQRLGLEGEHEAHVVQPGTHFFHLENWYSIHGLMRGALTLAGLHGRGRRNVRDIRCREHDVRLPHLPAAFEGFTLLQLSDLHLDLGEGFVERLIASVQGLVHDVCVLTGDYRFRTFGPYAPALAAMARLRPHLGERVLAVLGNHDTIRMVPGLEDDFHKAAAELGPDDCAILLSHTPEPYRHAAHAGFALMLSGHTHGGQICLPGGVPILTDSDAPRALARGAWRHQGMLGYTSVGCGASIVDVRLNCPPEVTLHRLHRA
ncbi:MAG: hypothetical protein MUE62_12350 [Burkholderiaceae bacterium]|nr:hypothetical protein [Burkholderiaceae bacterium]